MKIAQLIGLLILLGGSSLSYSAAIESQKRELIDQMIELAGSQKLIGKMAQKMGYEIIDAVRINQDVKVTQEFANYVSHEVKTAFYEDFVLSNAFNEIFYQLYDEYYSVKELKQLVEFLGSDVGQKYLKNMPAISERSFVEAKKHASVTLQKVHQRMKEKLEVEKQ